ncbi:MAG: hypothetical protein ACP5XB_08115 [Isosphaeraceae bacterium]
MLTTRVLPGEKHLPYERQRAGEIRREGRGTMTSFLLLLATVTRCAQAATDQHATQSFEAPKYGVTTRIPREWHLAAREKEDRVFVALISQDDPNRPGAVACELALAPESLEEYRSRIDSNARKRGRPSGKLASNRLIKDQRGERLETIWEFHPNSGGFWHEVTVRIIAHRQLYSFILSVEDAHYAAARTAFDAMVAATRFSSPNTGADLLNKVSNSWVQREYKFALDLPEGWSPVLAPSEVALLFADGPAHGVWSDNLLVLAHPRGQRDLNEQSRELPDLLKKEDPNCEILSCTVIKQGKGPALETVVRTRRGPFSMTVIERRFPGSRFDYEVKYTLESKRFDGMLPTLRKSLDSFRELPGPAPGGTGKAA